MTHTRSPVEAERAARIKLALAAYAYEYLSVSIMSDHEFDALARSIKPDMATWTDQTDPGQIKRSKKLDRFFKTKFHADTGMWIHQHPDLKGIASIYARVLLPSEAAINSTSPSEGTGQ